MAYLGSNPSLQLNKKLDPIVFDGTSSVFPLTANGNPVSPPVAEALIVSLNGVIQESQSAYTLSGSNIVFSFVPNVTDQFFGVILGEKVNIADVLPASGGTMTGFLTLVGNPVSAMQPTPKQYVDTAVAPLVSLTGTQTVTNKNIIEITSVVGVNTTAVAGTKYILTASIELTLPLNPIAGECVGIVDRSGTTTSIIRRNGKLIMGLAEDSTVDVPNFSATLMYTDVTRGWVIL